jgi:hypothetical protein
VDTGSPTRICAKNSSRTLAAGIARRRPRPEGLRQKDRISTGIGSMTRRGFTAMLTAFLVLGAIATAHAAVTYFGLTFPDRVGDAKIGPTRDFETTNPGLGYGVKYEKPGWAIDVFIYDLGRASIPDDPGSDVLKAQVDQAQGDVFEQQTRGAYADVKVTSSYLIKDARGQPRFLCEDFSYVRQNVGNVDSFLCLTGWHDKFVKFRLTTLHGSRSPAEARRFMEGWFKVLWP